jgi:hypothetical protein
VGETTGSRIGILIFSLTIGFCGMEIVPAWNRFGLGWSPLVYCAIMAVVGGLSGFLVDPDNRLAGLLGGLFAGPGALFTLSLVLGNTTRTNSVIMVMGSAVGAGPGILLYFILKTPIEKRDES